MWLPVILQTPFAGDVERNIRYARACMRDCLMRGEAPFASHLLYTQPGVLDDNDLIERRMGIEAGLFLGEHIIGAKTVVYLDLGISSGMRIGVNWAQEYDRPIEYRKLDGWAG